MNENEKNEIKTDRLLCSACLVRLDDTQYDKNEKLNDTLWGFNPYSYTTYKDLRYALNEFIQIHFYNNENNENKTHFYNSLNEEGYTFPQWNIYYLAKNDTKSKRLHLQTMWLFYLLSDHPFFSDMIRHGKRDDPLHNTLHHFMSYIEKYGSTQKKIMSLLISHGLNMDDTDSEGKTPASVLLELQMDKMDMSKCNELTRAYKELEKRCLSPLYDGHYIRLCEKCCQPVGLFEDISTHFDKIRYFSNEIQEMTRLREECNNIYKKYDDKSQSVQRHQYVIDLYKSLL